MIKEIEGTNIIAVDVPMQPKETVSEKIHQRAKELFGDSKSDNRLNDLRSMYILGAFEYRRYLIEEIDVVLPKIDTYFK